MKTRFQRTERLLGEKALKTLEKAKVAVFGIGGVGSYTVEALARSGVGALTLIDSDVVEETNINRQLVATTSTIGRAKVQVARDRILDINPDCEVTIHQILYLPETKNLIDFSQFDYVVDAIDNVTGKICLIEEAMEKNIPIISSMGTGNKLDPTAFEVTDISKTSVCPLAKVMRRELRKRNIDHLKVVYSKEEPIGYKVFESENLIASSRPLPASVAFVPSVAGLIIAGEVIKDITGIK